MSQLLPLSLLFSLLMINQQTPSWSVFFPFTLPAFPCSKFHVQVLSLTFFSPLCFFFTFLMFVMNQTNSFLVVFIFLTHSSLYSKFYIFRVVSFDSIVFTVSNDTVLLSLWHLKEKKLSLFCVSFYFSSYKASLQLHSNFLIYNLIHSVFTPLQLRYSFIKFDIFSFFIKHTV
jgi:hypothetical protein